jgi:VWFA-related protein
MGRARTPRRSRRQAALHLGVLLRLASAVLTCVFGAALLLGQNSDEVRVSSRVYTPASRLPIAVETREVLLETVVRDAQGRTVPALKQSDFSVLDEGKQRPISGFSVLVGGASQPPSTVAAVSASAGGGNTPNSAAAASSTPLRSVVLYFDDIDTSASDLRHAQTAAEAFVRQGMQTQDRVALATSSSSESLDFSTDKQQLLTNIEKIQAHPRISANGLATCPHIAPFQAFLIVTGDPAAYHAADKQAIQCNCLARQDYGEACSREQDNVVRNQSEQTWEQTKELSQNTLLTIADVLHGLATAPGTRTLVMASSGFIIDDPDLRRALDTVVDQALRASVVINTLDAHGWYDLSANTQNERKGMGHNEEQANLPAGTLADPFATLTEVLSELSESTGGKCFRSQNDLALGYDELAAAPQVSYLLTIAPDDLKPDGSFHKLQVKVKLAGTVEVQSRRGYFAPTQLAAQAATAAAEPQDALGREVLAEDTVSDLPTTLSARAGKNQQGQSALEVSIRVDVRQLSFGHREDRSTQKLTFIVALFDGRGRFVTGKEGELALALKPSTLEQMDQTGLTATFTLLAPAGSYRLRCVTQESVGGKVAAKSQPVEIQ